MQRSPTVNRLKNDQLHIHWPEGLLKGPVFVRWGQRPDGDPGDFRPIAVAEQSNEIEVADPSPGQRPYFLLVPAEGRTLMVAERRLPLAGQVNFRDLGGYVASDGRRVRWGQLYRSGDLGRLTDDDLTYLENLDLKLVCDLRVAYEVDQSPDRLPEGVAWLNMPVPGGEMPDTDLHEAVDNGIFSGLGADYLVRSNRLFVREFTPVYAGVLQRVLVSDDRPAVVHCTAGKDRAGLGAALVLLILGVPTETVFEDYLLTNTYRVGWTERILAMIRQAIVDRTGAPAETVDLSPVEALFIAHRAYLSAALATIDQEYGSFETYVRDGLGLSAEVQKAFQERLLE